MTLTATQIPTKAEVNLRRLLAVCEKQASEEISLIRGPDKVKYVAVSIFFIIVLFTDIIIDIF
jgi:hypothetical protein